MEWGIASIVVAGCLTIAAGVFAGQAGRAYAETTRLLRDVAERQARALETERRATEAMERLAGMSISAARRAVEVQAAELSEAYTAHVVASAERQARAEAVRRARGILAGALARVTQTPDRISYRSTVPLPDVPGLRARLVGREGRNLAAFAELTGVQLSLREGRPLAVLTALDPERRAMAEETLSLLMDESRVYESTIKVAYESVARGWPDRLVVLGREAARSAGAGELSEELALLMGRLHYRRLDGASALGHAVTGARIAAVLAAETGWPQPEPVVRAAFLRDLGYAVGGEPGHHAEAGAAAAAQHGEPAVVCQAIRHHHDLAVVQDDVPASLVACAERLTLAAADAPYEPPHLAIARLREIEGALEQLAGVASARVLGLADEVSVWVDPEVVPDSALHTLTLEAAGLVRSRVAKPVTVMVHRHTAVRAGSDGVAESVCWPGGEI